METSTPNTIDKDVFSGQTDMAQVMSKVTLEDSPESKAQWTSVSLIVFYK